VRATRGVLRESALFLRLNKKGYCTMTEIILKISTPQDLSLLLQLAERLGISYTQHSVAEEEQIKPSKKSIAFFARTKKKQALESRLSLMRQAANDPIFRADVEEVTNDFAHADHDEL
jgi:hypothetical protein